MLLLTSVGYKAMRQFTELSWQESFLEKDLGIKPKGQSLIHLTVKQTNPATSVGNDLCVGLLCPVELSSSQAVPVLAEWL